MANKGLTKLTEECGELTQIASKKIACPDSDTHWDDGGSLAVRLENEIADVQAASALVIKTHGLDIERINQRAAAKLALFLKWHSEAT